MNNNPLFAWQETKPGLVFIVLFDLLVAYGIGSLALDSGSLLQWTAALLFLVLAAGQSIKLLRKVFRHGR